MSLRGDRCFGGGGASGMVQVEDHALSASWGAGTQAASAGAVPCLLSLDRSRWEPHSRRRDCLDLAVRDAEDDDSTR